MSGWSRAADDVLMTLRVLGRSNVTPGELAQAAALPLRAVRAALEELEAAGAVECILTRDRAGPMLIRLARY